MPARERQDESLPDKESHAAPRGVVCLTGIVRLRWPCSCATTFDRIEVAVRLVSNQPLEAKLPAQRNMKNPVVGGMVAHGIFFVMLLAIMISGAQSLGRDTPQWFPVVVVGIPVATVIAIVSGAILYVNLTGKARLKALLEARPGATIVRGNWSSALLSPFLKPGPLLRHTNYRGFPVEVTADAAGISLWRGGHKIVDCGLLPWDRIRSVSVENVNAVIGKRVTPILVIEVDPGIGEYETRIELILTGESADVGASKLLARQPR